MKTKKYGNTIHGWCRTPTWNSWQKMRRRCTDVKDIGFPLYGGRGIQVCARWKDSFQNFLDDMGRPRKLSKADWADIVNSRSLGATSKELAARYSIHPAHVRLICRKLKKKVPDEPQEK